MKPQGAHGANRPGPKNYPAVLAEDYLYEQRKGRLEKYPDLVGIANVPESPGGKTVFDPDTGDDADEGDGNESGKGLGRNAEPFIFGDANKRPEHPTLKWLVKQLEKCDVGTGATRASTYSEVTSDKAKYPLPTEKGQKLRPAQAGEMSSPR
ncbi:hypothetical protein AB0F18_28560 [Streptomyces sp. NPDC029216]|uniref:hypothetical protein n=1 Tax=Streptomyces sp. NPDC029216 TaxID=3154701 RepID=UPI0033D724F7